jgi:hypothetical protein
VAETAGSAGAGLRSGIGGETKLQPERVHVVGNSFHSVREALRIGDDVSVRIAAHLPAVVDVDVLIACVFHA